MLKELIRKYRITKQGNIGEFLDMLPILDYDPAKVPTQPFCKAELSKNVRNYSPLDGFCGYIFGLDSSETLLYASSFTLIRDGVKESTSAMNRFECVDLEKVLSYEIIK